MKSSRGPAPGKGKQSYKARAERAERDDMERQRTLVVGSMCVFFGIILLLALINL